MTSIRFYTDVHIAREVVRQLQQKGVDIIHCGDVGMSDADDEDHLQYATANGRVMVTCDEDYEHLSAAWQAAGRAHGGIVYFMTGEKCKSIGLIVREILFLHEASVYEDDLYNRVWRV
jgi:hypothetical protein